MSRTSAVLMLALATLALTACTDASPPPDGTKPTAVATASPMPSPTPSQAAPAPSPTRAADEQDVTVPPERPAALGGPGTEENAKAVGRYFLSLFPYVVATGDLTAWDALSGQSCTYCSSVREFVTEIHDAGHHGEGGAFELGFTSGFDPVAVPVALVDSLGLAWPHSAPQTASASADNSELITVPSR